MFRSRIRAFTRWFAYVFLTLSSVVLSSFSFSASDSKNGVEFNQVSDKTWLYTAYLDTMDYGRVPINGVIFIDNKESIIIDLPSNDKDTAKVFEWVHKQGAKVKYVVPLHWHHDSSGGLSYAASENVSIVMLDKTEAILTDKRVNGGAEFSYLPAVSPDYVFSESMRLKIGGSKIELSHLGGGHSEDSVVAWIESESFLVAGCLIKSLNSKTLGNIADADMDSYLDTVQKIKHRYADAKFVSPGHGAVGDIKLLDHTANMVLEYTAKLRQEPKLY